MTIQAKFCRLSIPCHFVVLVIILGLACTSVWAQSPRPFAANALLELELAINDSVEPTVSPNTGLVTFLAFTPGKQPQVRLAGKEPALDRALDFLDDYGPAFGVFNRNSLSLQQVAGRDEVGMEHVRFRQTYQGVPVTGGELTVHLRDSAVVAVNSKMLESPGSINTTPVVTAGEAVVLAEAALADLGITGVNFSQPRLEILNKELLGGDGSNFILSWFIEAKSVGIREYIWIAAISGKPVLQFSQLTDARDRNIHDTNSSATLPGTLVRVEGGSATGDTDSDAAYDYSGDTYDYFFNEHGRDSYDGAGATIISTVDYCPSGGPCPFANAFWNGTQMVYGAGYPVADDVDAHELTHAVTEYTANLFYYMQSGALNESFSDIFGETVDLTNSGGTDTPAVRWQMGEDLPGFGAIRDMMDPTVKGDPGKLSDTEFVCTDGYAGSDDNGGVHSNSGVPNHAYALMVDGGSYNGFTVTGLGLTKAGKIQYRSLAYYLLSASDFLDNYNALKQSCQDLIGVAGITAADCTEVGEALDAVEMNSVWPCTPTQASVPDFCPASQAPDMWLYSDMEGIGLAACPSGIVPTSWCLNGPSSLLGSFATSGVNSLWGYNRPTTGFISLDVNTTGMLPANARLQFNHSYGFENTGTSHWDGGVIEYSTDGGTNWIDGGSLITAGQAYGGTISSGFGNPLALRSAFVRDTRGFTASQLDLSTLAGESFNVRYYLGTDFDFDDYGWFVDDIRIYSCSECLTNRVLDDAYNGTASLYQASNSVTAGSGYTVGLNEDVTFESGNFISLESGFSVGNGGQFTAMITPGTCP